jgi:hypothetical protein
MPYKVNIHAAAQATYAIVSEANPINPDREAFGKLNPFVANYSPYAADANATGSVEGIFKTMASGTGAPAAAAK